MREFDAVRGDRSLCVRDAGDPNGNPIVYFHATPGSRLDLAFADDIADKLGVRIVSFDRPGYGGSTPAAFGLVSVASDAAAIADELGIDRFATLGQSGGGPFSLAAAATLGERVTRAGVASGAGPFGLVPGALGQLDETDTAAVSLLPGDPVGAQRGFASGFAPLVSAFRGASSADIVGSFHDSLSTRDAELMQEEHLMTAVANSMREHCGKARTAAGGTTSHGSAPGKSMSRPSGARCSSSTATKTGFARRRTRSGCATTSRRRTHDAPGRRPFRLHRAHRRDVDGADRHLS